jgi:uncharacterized membrane protein YbhN (UPF0104 family)
VPDDPEVPMAAPLPQDAPLVVPPGLGKSPALWWRMALATVALLLVARVLWAADWARTGALLRGVGPWLLLALLPFAVGMGLDTVAWKRVLREIGSRVSYVSLLRMRLASEAVLLSAPGGAVAGEAVKTVLLTRQGVAPRNAVASIAIKKIIYILAHGLYMAVGLLCGREAIARISGHLHAPWVAAAYAAVTLAMLGLGIALALSWRLGGPAALSWRWLGRVPSARLHGWLQARAAGADAVDGAARAFFAGGAGTVGPVLGLLLVQWLTEAAETYLMLHLLGVEVSLTAVIAYDALNSFVRSAVFFLPAGLGVQELGQVVFVNALGVPEAGAVAAALMLCKRGKDLAWIVTGYGLLGRAWRTA